MEKKIFQRCVTWFDDHVNRYRELAGDDGKMVDRKQRHTMRVLDHVREIIKESGANPELCVAMEIAALLHDVGRFPQIVKVKTFDDQAGYNHAEAGARLLMESELLDPLPAQMRGVILSAVKYHNLAVLPDTLGPDARLVLDVVRNADKIDAIRNNLRYLNKEALHGKALKSGLTWHETEVSPEVLDLAKRRQLIPFTAINWSNDFILFLCCWLYDLHFNYSFVQLDKSGNFEALLAKLPDAEPFAEVKAQLRDDLHWIRAKS